MPESVTITKDDADRITRNLDAALKAFEINYHEILGYIQAAISMRIWEILGYDHPATYFHERFAALREQRLSRQFQAEVIERLAPLGLSNRLVGDALGIAHSTVHRTMERHGIERPEKVISRNKAIRRSSVMSAQEPPRIDPMIKVRAWVENARRNLENVEGYLEMNPQERQQVIEMLGQEMEYTKICLERILGTRAALAPSFTG